MERRAETASGDETAPGKLSGGGHLCSGGLGTQHVLPSAAGAERRGAARGIVKAGNRLPDLRLSPPDGTAGTTGLAGESQAGAAGHAGNGLAASGEKAENPHYQQRPFLPALPEPCRRCRSQTPRRYLGGGHHLRALGTRLRLSGGHYGCVHSGGARLASEPLTGSSLDPEGAATGVDLWTLPADPP